MICHFKLTTNSFVFQQLSFSLSVKSVPLITHSKMTFGMSPFIRFSPLGLTFGGWGLVMSSRVSTTHHQGPGSIGQTPRLPAALPPTFYAKVSWWTILCSHNSKKHTSCLPHKSSFQRVGARFADKQRVGRQQTFIKTPSKECDPWGPKTRIGAPDLPFLC